MNDRSKILVSEFRDDPQDVMRRVAEASGPLYYTDDEGIRAVILSEQVYEKSQRELEILRILARGEQEIEAGMGHDLSEVMSEADELLNRG